MGETYANPSRTYENLGKSDKEIQVSGEALEARMKLVM